MKRPKALKMHWEWDKDKDEDPALTLLMDGCSCCDDRAWLEVSGTSMPLNQKELRKLAKAATKMADYIADREKP